MPRLPETLQAHPQALAEMVVAVPGTVKVVSAVQFVVMVRALPSPRPTCKDEEVNP